MIFCAVCGTQKKSTNHWFVVWRERCEMRLCVMPFELDPAITREASVLKVCGDQCLHKAVQQYADFLKVTTA